MDIKIFDIAFAIRYHSLLSALVLKKIILGELKLCRMAANQPTHEEYFEMSEDEASKSPLHCAVKHGNIEMVKELLKHGAEVDSEDNFQCTPLMDALKRNQFDIAKLLLEYGANINHCDNRGMTALHSAAAIGHVKTIEFLLKNGANVNAIDNIKYSPLHTATEMEEWDEFSEHSDCVKMLLENGAIPNLKATHLLQTALHFAAQKGCTKMVELLLEYDIDIDALDSEQNSALHQAVENGHVEVVELLLQKGANCNVRDIHLFTPLHVAAIDGNADIVEILLKYYVDIDAIDLNTALELAAMGGITEVVKILLMNGADLNIRNYNRNTVLEEEIEKLHIGYAKMIIFHQRV